MRFCLAFSLLVACILHLSQSAQYRQPLEANADYPGQCYNPDTKQAINDNSTATDHESCTSLYCSADGKGGFMVIGTSCAIPRVWPENCVLTTPSLDLDYPFCCAQVECDGEPEGSFAAVGK